MRQLHLLCCAVMLCFGALKAERDKRQNPVHKVVSILNPPFLTLKSVPQDVRPLVGNERYEGYIMDLLKEVSVITGDEYVIYLTPDNRHGGRRRNGTWNGIVGELISENADLAAGSLTVSYTRSSVIDFGPSFMSTGVQILYHRPGWTTVNMFSPFAVQVWICAVVVFVLYGLGLYFIQRLSASPGSQERDKGRSELAKCADAYWVLIKSFSLQGLQDKTVGLGGRVLFCGWIVFSLVTLGVFFASLVTWFPALVHGVQDGVPFTDSKSLLSSGVTFGCVNAGSTKGFFRISSGTVYQKMYHRMESENSFVRTTAEGLEKVREGNFAFIGESQMIEYMAGQKPCDLVVVGERMTSNAYALATPKDSALKPGLDAAIIQLREEGVLLQLQEKWWTTSQCDAHADAIAQESHQMPEKVNLLRYLEIGPVIFAIVGLVAGLSITGVQSFLRKRNRKETAPSEADASPQEQAEPAPKVV